MNQKSASIDEHDEEVFAQVAEVWENLRTNALKASAFQPQELLSEWLQVLTGSFMFLNTRYVAARVARSNNELSAYMTLKKDAAVAGEKFVNASAEKDAKSQVGDHREAERIFESYKDAAEQGILTLKKLLDVYVLELKREAR